MAAGLGFKDFVTGEVLTAADVDGYLMQGVWVFASAAARDAAVTSPQEGNFAYLKDTNVTTYYTGSAWANLDTTGMTNPMTTTGDTIYSSSGSTPARLGIGSTGQVLTVAGGVPSWATASSGGMTLISTTSITASSTISLTSIPATYKDLRVVVRGFLPNNDNVSMVMRFEGDPNARYKSGTVSTVSNGTFDATNMTISAPQDNNSSTSLIVVNIFDYANTSTIKMMVADAVTNNPTTNTNFNYSRNYGVYKQTGAIDELNFRCSDDDVFYATGTILLYGVN